jgi:hypothetical protein
MTTDTVRRLARSRAGRLAPWLALAWLLLVQAVFYRNMLGRFGDEVADRIEGVVAGLGF